MKNTSSVNKAIMLILLFFGVACQEVDYNQEFSATFPISGDWTISVNDGTTVSGPYFMKIYNTATSKDSVWIDDNSTFWQTKTKAKIDLTSRTFSATNAQNEYYDSQVTYTNGKLIGNDSIYFEVKFSDDTTNTNYIYSGHRKVSYEEYNTPQ